MYKGIKRIVRRLRRGLSGTPAAATQSSSLVRVPRSNLFISDEIPPAVAEISARYKQRRITHFLVGSKITDQQNALIAQSVRSFFDRTASLGGSSQEQLTAQISEFREVYLNAPITMNNYGVHFSTGLFLFLIARRRNPALILESGVYKGLSTYLLSAACQKSVLHAFDPNLNELTFRSSNANYHAMDWMQYDIECEPPGSGLVFFDDHQCQASRVVEAYDRGFRHLVFDDSWRIEAVMGCGWPPVPSIDMIMNESLEANEIVQWMEDGRIWTYVHDQDMQQLSAKARALISAAYDVPSLYRETGLGPTSAMTYVELVP